MRNIMLVAATLLVAAVANIIAMTMFSESYVVNFHFSINQRSAMYESAPAVSHGYQPAVTADYGSHTETSTLYEFDSSNCLKGKLAIEFMGDREWSVEGLFMDKAKDLFANIRERVDLSKSVVGKKTPLFSNQCVEVPQTVHLRPVRLMVVEGKIISYEN